MPSAPVLALEQVSRSYDRGRVRALDHVDLMITHGERVAVIGPSGSGKSTLLHVLSGLDHTDSGVVRFCGRVPDGRDAWTRLRATHIGFVFQAFHLLPTLSALENVQVPMLGVIRDAGERRLRAQDLLARVGLTARAAHRPAELSSGEKQRVAIARALANRPDVLLCDEPTGNLDSANGRAIVDLLMELNRDNGMTVVTVTHNPDVAARSDRVYAMRDGRLAKVAEGGA